MKIERPKQQLPAEIVSDLMGAIRGQFYPDASAKQWAQDSVFIRREFVLYFASWLNKKGVTLKPERYKQILLERLQEVKQHGRTDAIRYFPGYLKHVLQQHLKHHGQDYYDEGKNLRAIAENALVALGQIGPCGSHSGPDPIRVMAEARHEPITIKIDDSKITYNWLPQGSQPSPEETRTYERLKAAIDKAFMESETEV